MQHAHYLLKHWYEQTSNVFFIGFSSSANGIKRKTPMIFQNSVGQSKWPNVSYFFLPSKDRIEKVSSLLILETIEGVRDGMES